MSTIERYAFMLTLLAGLATLLGSLIALFAKRTNTKLLALPLEDDYLVCVLNVFITLKTDYSIF